MAREPFLVENLWIDLLLLSTDTFKTLLDKRLHKRGDIWREFCFSEAIIDSIDDTNVEIWMKSTYELLHTTTRVVARGFHHKICRKSNCHTSEDNCF
jgi:hypothetical protein